MNIYQILIKGVIVFCSQQYDTIISIEDGYLKWWLITDNEFSLLDTLNIKDDIATTTISFAKEMAQNWFEHIVEENIGTTNSVNININEKKASQKIDPVSKLPIAEIPFLDYNKKDQHTEHCCGEHFYCIFDNKNCTIANGVKKPTYYGCTCERKL